MELKLNGKRCLISGGSKGIGLAIKKALEAEGVEVISWSRSEGVDLSNLSIMSHTYPDNIDILINNVGGMGRCTFDRSWECMKMNYGETNILTELVCTNKKNED